MPLTLLIAATVTATSTDGSQFRFALTYGNDMVLQQGEWFTSECAGPAGCNCVCAKTSTAVSARLVRVDLHPLGVYCLAICDGGYVLPLPISSQ